MQSDKHINNVKETKNNQKSPDDHPDQNQLEPHLTLHLPTADTLVQSELEQNSNEKHNDNQFECNICNNFETDSKKNLRAHKQIVHGICVTPVANGQFNYNSGTSKTNSKTDKLDYNSGLN